MVVIRKFLLVIPFVRLLPAGTAFQHRCSTSSSSTGIIDHHDNHHMYCGISHLSHIVTERKNCYNSVILDHRYYYYHRRRCHFYSTSDTADDSTLIPTKQQQHHQSTPTGSHANDIRQQQPIITNNNRNINITSNFVKNVTTWFHSINISYVLHHVPMSSVITTMLALQHGDNQQQQMLYILQFILPPSTNNNNPNELSKVLLLHLIPSPPTTTSTSGSSSTTSSTSERCIPAGVTQYMTNHPPNLVVEPIQNEPNAQRQQQVPQHKDGNPKKLTTATAYTTTTEDNHIQIIHLHEDIWDHQRTNPIVRARLLCRLGMVQQRLFGRHTTVRRIDRTLARDFLQCHHLWGTTASSKYSYGLYYQKKNKNQPKSSKDCTNNNNTTSRATTNTMQHPNTNEEVLVAVATFSSRRKVRRGRQHQQIYRSHELIRVCCCRDMMIVGGISKLITAFIRDNHPVDDIVTVIDRDWGIGQANWYTLGFATVATMKPIPMVIKDGIRRHLIGSGIRCEEDDDSHGTHNNTAGKADVDSQQQQIRLGLPKSVLLELEHITSYNEAVQCLHHHGYYLIYDAGVERLLRLTSKDNVPHDESAESLWDSSIPQYATQHYSSVAGINAIIEHVSNQDYS